RGARDIAGVVLAASPVVGFGPGVARDTALADLARGHLGWIQDVSVTVGVDVRLTRAMTGLAAVLGRRRPCILRPAVRSGVILLTLILVALEALLLANVFPARRT